MIDEIELTNFRAFKKQKLNFRKLNIFVGPNNSGKSSAISALNLIAQSAIEVSDGVPLILKGAYDDFGTFNDLVYRNNIRNHLGLKIKLGKYEYFLKYKYRSQRREIDIIHYEINFSGEKLYLFKSTKDAYSVQYGGSTLDELGVRGKKRRPTFNGMILDNSSFWELRRAAMGSHVKREQLEISDETLRLLRRVDIRIREALRMLNGVFQQYDSLGPFREPPSRTYHFSGGYPRKVGRTGGNAIDILVGDNFRRDKAKRNLVESVSNWFQKTNMASSLNVNNLTSRHYEICLKTENGYQYNLCDVGFGCSQVLPVLVGGLNSGVESDMSIRNRSSSTFVVQEPEIHLHPNAQAELGTFLVECLENGTQLFVETHSDNIILRIQQHVAQGRLEASDVKVFYVSRHEGESNLQELTVDEYGIFNEEWPDGFFPQRHIESRQLALLTSKSKQKAHKSSADVFDFGE